MTPSSLATSIFMAWLCAGAALGQSEDPLKSLSQAGDEYKGYRVRTESLPVTVPDVSLRITSRIDCFVQVVRDRNGTSIGAMPLDDAEKQRIAKLFERAVTTAISKKMSLQDDSSWRLLVVSGAGGGLIVGSGGTITGELFLLDTRGRTLVAYSGDPLGKGGTVDAAAQDLAEDVARVFGRMAVRGTESVTRDTVTTQELSEERRAADGACTARVGAPDEFPTTIPKDLTKGQVIADTIHVTGQTIVIGPEHRGLTVGPCEYTGSTYKVTIADGASLPQPVYPEFHRVGNEVKGGASSFLFFDGQEYVFDSTQPVQFLGWEITSTKDFPLTFKLRDRKLVYLCGKGTIAREKESVRLGEQQDADLWRRQLRSADAVVVEGAVQALGWLKEDEALADLAPLLKHESVEIRSAVVEAIGRIGGKAAVTNLKAALGDAHLWVRRAAARAFGVTGTAEGEAVVRAALATEKDDMVKETLEAVVKKPQTRPGDSRPQP